MCKGFTSLSLQSVQSLNIKLLLISGSKWGGQADFSGSPQAEGIRSNWKSLFLSHHGKKLWAMARPHQGSQALTLFQSYISAEWNNTSAKCTEKSHLWALANLSEGYTWKGAAHLYTTKYEHSRALQPVSLQRPCALEMISSSTNGRSASWRGIQKCEAAQQHFMYGSHVWRVPDEIWAILALL